MRVVRTSSVTGLALASGLLGLATLSGCDTPIIGSVNVPAGATAEGATTVNGGVNVGDGAKVGATATVNGGVRIGDNVTAESARTVNGGIRIGSGTKIAQGVDTVNGGIDLGKGSDVAGKVMTVNGGIRLNASHVGGGISTYNGDIDIGRGSHVEGRHPCGKARRPPAHAKHSARRHRARLRRAGHADVRSRSEALCERHGEDRAGGRRHGADVLGRRYEQSERFGRHTCRGRNGTGHRHDGRKITGKAGRYGTLTRTVGAANGRAHGSFDAGSPLQYTAPPSPIAAAPPFEGRVAIRSLGM